MIRSAEFLKGLPAKFVACRDLRHSWDISESHSPFDGMVVRRLFCMRCGAKKYQALRNGRVEHTAMKFPDGYLKGKTVERGRIDRTEVVAESVMRSKITRRTASADVIEFMQRRGV